MCIHTNFKVKAWCYICLVEITLVALLALPLTHFCSPLNTAIILFSQLHTAHPRSSKGVWLNFFLFFPYSVSSLHPPTPPRPSLFLFPLPSLPLPSWREEGGAEREEQFGRGWGARVCSVEGTAPQLRTTLNVNMTHRCKLCPPQSSSDWQKVCDTTVQVTVRCKQPPQDKLYLRSFDYSNTSSITTLCWSSMVLK